MKNLIQTIIQDRLLYGRFLNTLSLLEYIGARKILKSQHQDFIDDKILRHVAEEIRHAQVLKRAALKYAPDICRSYHSAGLLCGEAACHYFQTIDSAARDHLGEHDARIVYLYTTYLAETRATVFYQLFESTLLELNEPSVFRGILTEEERHLQDVLELMDMIPNGKEKIAILKNIEEKEFSIFMGAIKEYCAA